MSIPRPSGSPGVLKDPQGLPFTIGFVDGVMRPESLAAAASNLNRVAPLVPKFLPWYLRGAVQVGGAVAPVLPSPVVPIARRVLREMVGHLVVDARPDKLGPAIAKIRENGAKLNLNLLGEAVLGEQEALRRLDGIHELIRRPDVDYVSVKVSAIASHISMWAFDDVVDKVVERLMPLYLTAVTDATFINLDMEEYRDLDLTIAVFTRILEDPRLQQLEAGIVLQAYLPDALPALEQLTAWARARVAGGGARIKVRLVKGANLAMERVDAVMHDWSLATYGSKLDSDANYLRCLDYALQPEHAGVVRIGVAGHNLFDIAYAWLLAGERDVRSAVEFEMLLGMAQGQVEAVAREVGHVLLYVPVVRPDEFDVAISYLVRRLEENASSENFLSAAFELADEPAMFDRERDRFVASIDRATQTSLSTGPNRGQDRTAEPREHGPRSARRMIRDGRTAGMNGVTDGPESNGDTISPGGLTQAVMGIARTAAAADAGDTAPLEPVGAEMMFGGDAFVETAVFASRQADDRAVGAPGFRNAADTDPSLPANRVWSSDILARIDGSTAGDATIAAALVTDADTLEATVARVRHAAAAWGAQPASERAAVLEAAARALEARRGELIEVAASETGKVFAEADVEVSEAVDFANYYAATARELDRVSGAVFVPSQLTVVTPPWNFPVAIPAGGVLAALAAGSGVVFKPAPQARRCAAVLAEALWEAGVPARCAGPRRHRRRLSRTAPRLAPRCRPGDPHRLLGDGGAVPLVAPRAAPAGRDQRQERHDRDAVRRPRPGGIRPHQERVRPCRSEVLGRVARDPGRTRRSFQALRATAGGCRDLAARRAAQRSDGRGRARDRAAPGQARVGPHDPRRGREMARRAGTARLRTGVRGAVLESRHPHRRPAGLALPP